MEKVVGLGMAKVVALMAEGTGRAEEAVEVEASAQGPTRRTVGGTRSPQPLCILDRMKL
uniref:Uncharacterized protein n=1 Tax=Musa acuminata subsp. malaccensis TaxID=214687 RepID=A0A804K5Y6_MUSAM